MAALKMPQCAPGKASTVAKRPPVRVVCCFIYSKTNNFKFIFVPYIKPLPWKVQRMIFRGRVRLVNGKSPGFEKSEAIKIKRAGPSHKPHPKATCPHPTRPLRPAGSRAPHDYAQVAQKMQLKLRNFFSLRVPDFASRIESLFVIDPIILSGVKQTQCCAAKR
jgi:hypothetical protein